MKFTVTWKASAETDLTRFWLAASPVDRLKIRLACRDLERALSGGPSKIGKSYADEVRIVVCRPLAVIVAVSEPDRRIDVLTVHLLDS